ncbi:MAG: hypothetical protein M5U18_04355 [Dehalococcoidia bacterium]|nr:hypothetical protein [Dehalococcoidia bacterium]
MQARGRKHNVGGSGERLLDQRRAVEAAAGDCTSTFAQRGQQLPLALGVADGEKDAWLVAGVAHGAASSS